MRKKSLTCLASLLALALCLGLLPTAAWAVEGEEQEIPMLDGYMETEEFIETDLPKTMTATNGEEEKEIEVRWEIQSPTYAITKATESKRYKVENSVNPKYEIDEYDLPLIEEVYEEIKFIMATQGYKMDDTQAMLNEANILHTTRNGVQAFGVYHGENFEVLEGSEVDLTRKCHSDKMELQRQTAVQNGDISISGNRHKLTVSISFASPSSAAMFVLGGSRNGWIEWKDADGKTLDELFRRP